MPYWPGRRPNVNDKHRGMVTPLRSVSQLEGLMTPRALKKLQTEMQEQNLQESRAGWRSEKDIVKVQKAIKLIGRSRDKRRRPSKVDSKTFRLVRELKLKHPSALKGKRT